MSKEGDYAAVAEAIRKIIPKEGYDDGSAGPVLVRLAWHASGTYDKASDTGGSNGATMRYKLEADDGANSGLEYARAFLEPIKQQFPWISYADLWTFAGTVALEYMGGPKIQWKPGRVDYADDSNVPPNGRLPDGAQGADHLRHIFYRMGFNDQEIVALSGAHNLGRTHANRSGFDGPWVPNPTRFSNTYFKLLLNEEWYEGKSPAGVRQFYDEDKDLMMLPTDMALIEDPKFRSWVEKYAKDKDAFYEDFAKVFAKLLELGIKRGPDGKAVVNVLKAEAKL
ncbi:Putative cytochrome c peroxidase, mitochondrial [Wickerhamiella sorbophila]|uniref:Peroxidase n=1 Tax=Wickerhamiella sorbophila TaxID=45607 RepID=A0A2T0FBZ2_9ASCO|nr:Putative cytochrome c peroxidase, mitochondrial [Wickerhamiella sorbophila]PRT52459.1 Putative cytochrome c peroxidase, mitochondrial [Wickerhamiella sorbophila]